jgi:hypothetical protein
MKRICDGTCGISMLMEKETKYITKERIPCGR